MAQALIRIDARYDADPDCVFAAARSFDALAHALKGIAAYRRLPAGAIAQAGETYVTDIWFWGLFPTFNHKIHVAFCDPLSRRLQTRESHRGIQTWNCEIQVDPRAGGGATWSERIAIDAGAMTPLVARFAAFTYRTRHRRGIPDPSRDGALLPAQLLETSLDWATSAARP